MDFSKTEAAQDRSGLVRTIVDSVCTPAHQRMLDGLDQRFDEALWEKLIHADILNTAAPENTGGGGVFCGGALGPQADRAASAARAPPRPINRTLPDTCTPQPPRNTTGTLTSSVAIRKCLARRSARQAR